MPALADGGPLGYDELGWTVATTSLGADATPGLVIDKRQDGEDPPCGGGIIHVLGSSIDGLVVDPNQAFSLDTPGMIGGPSQPCNQFGVALSTPTGP